MKVGTTLDVRGQRMQVRELLGTGGEGEVFRIDGTGGQAYALKWYHQPLATDLRRQQIGELIQRGAPSDSFLWPHGLIDDATSGRFGYLMDLRPADYVGIAAVLNGKAPRHEAAVVRFSYELAAAFRDLHIAGLCYRDINFGNAFVDAATGSALICDNDNVGIEGVGRSNVRGTPKFWAPEVAASRAMPSKYTDRYSLAVMLFYVLLAHHPLEGARTEAGLADAEANLRHYVYDPLFCFDPANDANRPHPDYHPHVEAYWHALPSECRELFIRSFTDGLREPRDRVVDSEWCGVLAAMRDHFWACETCTRPTYLGTAASDRCPHCGTDRTPPLTMKVDPNGHTIVVRPGAVVSAHHLDGNYDFDWTVGAVEAHPSNPSVLGFRNDGAGPIRYIDARGTARQVPSGRRATLEPGVSIEIGRHTISVRSAE